MNYERGYYMQKEKLVGKRFKQYREKVGLTQEALAEKLDLHPNYISRIERGTSFPGYAVLIKILNTLEISADAILCDVVNESKRYRESELFVQLKDLELEEQNRILDVIELLVKQAKERAE
jgi:transcriptional regulator with XRE-family HTH domain